MLGIKKSNCFIMVNIFTYTILVLGAIYVTACSSPKKLYNKGNYEAAFYKAINKSTSAKKYNEHSPVIEQCYQYAVEDFLREANQAENYRSDFPQERKLSLYERIEKMNDAAYKNTFVRGSFPLTNVQNQITTVTNLAINDRVREVERYMSFNNKQYYQKAYRIAVSGSYKFPQSDVLQNLAISSYDAALVRVVVVVNPFNFRNISFNNAMQKIENALITDLQFATNNNLIKYYTAQELVNNAHKIDYYLQYDIDYRNTNHVEEKKQNYQMEKSIPREVRYRPDSIVTVLDKAKANYIERKQFINAEAKVSMALRSPTTIISEMNRVLYTNYNWENIIASYEGDDRALSAEQLTSIRNNDKHKLPPNMQDVVLNMQKELVKKSANEIEMYFSRNYNTPF
jgi:hypothetical protein